MIRPATRRHRGPRLSRTHAEAVLVIAECGRDGVDNDRLAASIGCAPDTVKSLLRVLEERGLIRIQGARDARLLFANPHAVDLARQLIEDDLYSLAIPGDGGAEDPRYQERERRCLTCGEDFLSSWAGNRICGRCKNLSTAGIL